MKIDASKATRYEIDGEVRGKEGTLVIDRTFRIDTYFLWEGSFIYKDGRSLVTYRRASDGPNSLFSSPANGICYSK